MAWRRPGDKPLSETIMVRLPTNISVTRPQCVKHQRLNQMRLTCRNPVCDFHRVDCILLPQVDRQPRIKHILCACARLLIEVWVRVTINSLGGFRVGVVVIRLPCWRSLGQVLWFNFWNILQPRYYTVSVLKIDQCYKSHCALTPYPTMHRLEQICAHFCSEWCIVGYGTSALRDLRD